MAANREHPDYPIYIEQCKKLRDEFLEEVKDCVPEGGLDGNQERYDAERRHNRKLKQLQAKYKHLFE